MASYDVSVISAAISTASRKLGFLQLKQKSVVETFLNGRDVFVSLPTGSGQSLCYALLPAAFDSLRTSERSIVIVVSIDEGPGPVLRTKGSQSSIPSQWHRRRRPLRCLRRRVPAAVHESGNSSEGQRVARYFTFPNVSGERGSPCNR